MKKLKIGDQYIVPSGTRLWFIDLQQSLITTKKYVIEVTHTVTTDDTTFFGDLYEVTFEGMQLPGLRKLSHGETSVNLEMVEPMGDILTPKDLSFRYNRNNDSI